VPELTHFCSIVIAMVWRDRLPSHLQTNYAGHESGIFLDGALLGGSLAASCLRTEQRVVGVRLSLTN